MLKESRLNPAVVARLFLEEVPMKKKLLVPLLTLGVFSLGTVPLFAAVTESSTNVPLAIPDNGNVDSTLNFSVNGTITDANLTVDIAHTWNDDIELRLTSPSVAAQLLYQDCGGSGDNFQATLDQDAAALSTCPTTGPITGSILPTNGTGAAPVAATGTLDAFNGSASGGVWTLNVADDSAICTGTLNAWSLTLDGSAPLPVELMNFEVE
jgi:subtilisin-like proprotein convertase family protein